MHVAEALEVTEAHAWPAGQTVHTDCPPIEYVPASQGVDKLDVVEAQAWPAEQFVH